MPYTAHEQRYDDMQYRRCGRSGLSLSALSLGLWHNFADVDSVDNARAMLRTAFDLGITHFDLANNYGPPPGSAELTMGRLLREDFAPYRDELIISSKAGYRMTPGPYGDGGSRKYLLSSLDASLRRMGLDYVDIFYHHRRDTSTPLEETMAALDHAVRSGRALYVGLSNYNPEDTATAVGLLRELGTPCLIHQPSYSMLRRGPEEGLLHTLGELGVGCIAFSPLAQGQLSDKYLGGTIPSDSRAAKKNSFLQAKQLTPQRLATIGALNELALQRSQSLAQLALSWVLRHENMTSVLVGASRKEQIIDSVGCLTAPALTAEELARIDAILAQEG